MKRDGASDGSTVGFLVSTPQTGIDSILVSSAFLGTPFAIFKVLSAALMGIVAGVFTELGALSKTDRLEVRQGSERKRTWRDGLLHALMVVQSIWIWLVFGIILSAVISTLLPANTRTSWAISQRLRRA